MQLRIRQAVIPRIDFHVHTCWTDGLDTVRSMHAVAVDNRLEALLFSEHASPTSDSWFSDFVNEVRALPQSPCHCFVGAEVRVKDFDGNLAVSPNILDHCDLVIGSVHRFPGPDSAPQDFSAWTPEEAVAMERRLALALLGNPRVDILGHPFGMTLARFGQTPPEHEMVQIIRKAADTGVCIEINARYHPAPFNLLRLCLRHGARVSLGSDAHSALETGLVLTRLQGN